MPENTAGKPKTALALVSDRLTRLDRLEAGGKNIVETAMMAAMSRAASAANQKERN